MIKFLYLSLFLLLTCTACRTAVQTNEMTFQVNPERLTTKGFDKFYRLKEVIPLETTDSSLLSVILKVIAVKDRLFISTWDNQIFSFSRDGKFIGKVGKYGRGPGEYQLLTDFVVTKNPEQLVICDAMGKFVYYNWEGDCLREEACDGHIANLEFLPDNRWLINHTFGPTNYLFRDTAYLIKVMNADRVVVQGEFVCPPMNHTTGLMPSVFFKNEGHYYTAPLTKNAIYEYDCQTSKFESRYNFEIKDYPLPSVLVDKGMEDPFYYNYYFLISEFVGKNTVLANAYCLKEQNLITIVADKRDGKALVFPEKPIDWENELVLNRYFQHTGFKGDIVFYTQALEILENEFKNPDSVGSKLQKQIKEEDNPILLIYEER